MEKDPILEEMRVILSRAHPLGRERKLSVINETMTIPGMALIVRHAARKWFGTDQFDELQDHQLNHIFEYCRSCSLLLEQTQGNLE